MKVGFIGVGNIGRPMAAQVMKAGFELVVHDIKRESADSLTALGAEWAESPQDVAERCQIICACLPGPTEMREVVLGGRGVIQGIGIDAIFVDHTTNSPLLVREVKELLSERGAKMLDAPVSGGMEGAQTRDLTMLVGGESETLEEAKPVLDAMAKTVMHVGGIGAGCVCKVMHNCAGFSLNLAMMECLTLGAKAGVSPDVLVEVFQKCALGSNFDIQVRLPDTIFRGDFQPRFALSTARKDMAIATELARAYSVQMKLTDTTEAEMEKAISRGWGGSDSSIFLTLQEERTGVQIRTNGQSR